MSDIEDMIEEAEVSNFDRIDHKHSAIFPHLDKRPRVSSHVTDAAAMGNSFSSLSQTTTTTTMTSSTPGSQTIWLKTYGCSHNVSDSEYMQGILTSYGYRFVDESSAADVWLINSCTVKDPSQAAFMHLVKKGQGLGKAVVVAGCVPQGERKVKGLEHQILHDHMACVFGSESAKDHPHNSRRSLKMTC